MASTYAKRLRSWNRLFRAIAMMVLMIGLMSASRANEVPQSSHSLNKKDCVRMLASDAAKKVSKADVASAQQQLIELGFMPDGVDGLLGAKTRSAIAEFCKVDEVYPGWTQILGTPDFMEWMNKQTDLKEIDKIRHSGNSSELIALLARYKQRKTSTSSTWQPDDSSTSYSLTQKDFDLLKSPDEVLKLIAKLQGKKYASEDRFKLALEAALKEVAASEPYMNIIMQNGALQNGSTLTEQSFNELKVDVPSYILQAIQSLKDVSYPGNEIGVAVKTSLDNLDKEVMQFESEIIQLAEISPSGAKFTDAALGKFSKAHKDDLLAAVILDKLQNMKKVQYQNDKTMARALENVLGQVTDEIDSYSKTIVASAEKMTGYGLSKDSISKIQAQLDELSLPEVYLELLAGMQGVDYPDADLFADAMQARLSMKGSSNIIKNKIFQVFNDKKADEVNEGLLNQLKANGVPPAVVAKLGDLQGHKFDDTKKLEEGVDKMFEQLSATLQGCKRSDANQSDDVNARGDEAENMGNSSMQEFNLFCPRLVEQARKTHPFDKTKNIQWSGGACNCVHNNLPGEVYGFYPYWMAGEKQVIDFSVQTRIGYYGLSFDDKGNIANDSRWSNLETDFIREARKYGTKLDLVVYRNNWDTWESSSTEQKKEAFDKLAANIVRLVTIPLTDSFSRMKPYISMGTYPPSTKGDGVTLYFDGYPQDQGSVDAFGAFIRTLAGSFKAKKRKYSVNFMFRSSEIGRGIYDYQKLLDTMAAINGESKKSNGYFLVILHEPTTKDKKKLRQKIENGLHGEDRVKLLRNVVMALTFDGQSTPQLEDDIIYAKDNFGGIGFWPQPVLPASGVSAALNEKYRDAKNGDGPQLSAICQIVCPNRWIFRIALDIFALTLVACVFLYLWVCTWRSLINKYFMYFIAGVVAPTFLISISMLFCDPAWSDYESHSALIMVVVGVIAYSIWNYQENKKKANLP